MSPEAKELLDYLLAFAGPGAAGGVALAFFGWLKAKAEKPHIADKPSVGPAGLAQIGGMVMGQGDLKDLIDGLRGISASHDRCTLVREAEMLSRKEEAKEHREHERRLLEERRQHEQRLAEDRHREHRELVEALQGIAGRMRDFRCAN